MPLRDCEQRRMQCRHQRRALPARRDIPAAEVRDDRDSRGLNKSGRIGELRRVAQLGTMANGLAVDADGGDRACLEPGLCQHVTRRSGTAIHQRVGRERGAMDLIAARSLQRVKLRAQRWRKRDMRCGNGTQRRGAEVREHRVDAVDARARHHADIVLGCHTRGL